MTTNPAARATVSPRGVGGAVIMVILAFGAWALYQSERVPAFELVAQQGRMFSIVVDERVAADDAALLRIADAILPQRRGQLHVWTDRRLVPEHILDTTAAQFEARRALVSLNPTTGERKVEARHAPPARTP